MSRDLLYETWDKMKYPPHTWKDVDIHNDNLKNKRKLCEHCDGTGNEFFSMYHKCPECNGNGYKE